MERRRMPRLEIGDQAPEFCLPDIDGNETCLSELNGSFAVLYFYPKDNTMGCTMEARDFTKQLERFNIIEVPVIGISPDSPESHRNFVKKHQIKVKLLSDEDHKVLERYGVWQEKNLYGKRSFGVVRTTFILNPEGRVAAVWQKVKVPGHVDEVLNRLAQLMS